MFGGIARVAKYLEALGPSLPAKNIRHRSGLLLIAVLASTPGNVIDRQELQQSFVAASASRRIASIMSQRFEPESLSICWASDANVFAGAVLTLPQESIPHLRVSVKELLSQRKLSSATEADLGLTDDRHKAQLRERRLEYQRPSLSGPMRAVPVVAQRVVAVPTQDTVADRKPSGFKPTGHVVIAPLSRMPTSTTLDMVNVQELQHRLSTASARRHQLPAVVLKHGQPNAPAVVSLPIPSLIVDTPPAPRPQPKGMLLAGKEELRSKRQHLPTTPAPLSLRLDARESAFRTAHSAPARDSRSDRFKLPSAATAQPPEPVAPIVLARQAKEQNAVDLPIGEVFEIPVGRNRMQDSHDADLPKRSRCG
jgi:hypothetical protein